MLCLALGLASRHCSRLILSGISFEITHAYADNPLIASAMPRPGTRTRKSSLPAASLAGTDRSSQRNPLCTGQAYRCFPNWGGPMPRMMPAMP